ncbi:hypothetical protein KAI60_00370 [Candidatus Bathyarchaeota archaeon]|nr:hypothetical protein [Candidatus Bathyarchaeota archaeon]
MNFYKDSCQKQFSSYIELSLYNYLGL